MAGKNLERMIRLAEEFFGANKDPQQIQIDERVLARLRKIHPASITEKSLRDGPIAWMLVLPTSHRLMELFVAKQITERELFRRTHAGGSYDAAYLCSALVLPEYRGKGWARRLMIQSIKAIQKQHPVRFLFYWPFGTAGEKLAEDVADKLHLPLYKRAA
jgi:ribosomal protein S18 acetylase RimI-like enzyme